jgi:hypothetical protein
MGAEKSARRGFHPVAGYQSVDEAGASNGGVMSGDSCGTGFTLCVFFLQEAH